MQAEIITTGTELLLGQIVDTNAAYMAAQLTTIGLNMFRKTTVGDNELRTAQAIQEAMERSDIIIITGGLGPTVDDVTREAVARAVGRELVFDPELMRQIEERFRVRGRTMTPNNRKQAFIPKGAIPVENPVGTAPSFIVETPRGGAIIVLPGVPRELYYLMEHAILPWLGERYGLQGVIKVRVLHTCAIGESAVDALIGDLETKSNPSVGLAAKPGQTDVRITAKAESDQEAQKLIEEMEATIRERLGDVIFGADKDTLEMVVAGMFRKGKTLAILETSTGGVLAARLTSAEGDLKFLRQALVVTTPEALGQELGLSAEVADPEGLASESLAQKAAARLREKTGADLALAALGSMGWEEVYSTQHGVTFLAVASARGIEVRKLEQGGRTETSRHWTANTALDMLRRNLLDISQ